MGEKSAPAPSKPAKAQTGTPTSVAAVDGNATETVANAITLAKPLEAVDYFLLGIHLQDERQNLNISLKLISQNAGTER